MTRHSRVQWNTHGRQDHPAVSPTVLGMMTRHRRESKAGEFAPTYFGRRHLFQPSRSGSRRTRVVVTLGGRIDNQRVTTARGRHSQVGPALAGRACWSRFRGRIDNQRVTIVRVQQVGSAVRPAAVGVPTPAALLHLPGPARRRVSRNRWEAVITNRHGPPSGPYGGHGFRGAKLQVVESSQVGCMKRSGMHHTVGAFRVAACTLQH